MLLPSGARAGTVAPIWYSWSVTLATIDRGMRKYLARLKELDSLEIVAGHVGANALEPHPKSSGVTKLDVSRFVQFGTARMPARPYMDYALLALQSDPALGHISQEARNSRKSPKNALKPLGRLTAKAVRDAIVAVGAVDTGATRDAVRYQIRSDGRVVHEGSAS